MSDIEAAIERLMKAIAGLDTATSRLEEKCKVWRSQQEDIDALSADRSRLAQEIDELKIEAREREVLAQAREGLAQEAKSHVVRAMEDVHTVLSSTSEEEVSDAPD